MGKKAAVKFPAFQMYPSEWLACPLIMRMKPAQEGAYIRLINIDWVEDGLLDDIDVIARLSRISKKQVEFIMTKWIPHPRKPGFLTHPRCEKERKKQRAFRRKKSKSGKAGAKKRWGPSDNQGVKPDQRSDGDAMNSLLANDGSLISISISITIFNIYMHRIGAMKGRGVKEEWDKKEIKALAALGEIPEADLDILARYYGMKILGRDYRRKTLLTLLKNWKGELDQARGFRYPPSQKQVDLTEPPLWTAAWGGKLGHNNFESEWDNLLRDQKIEIIEYINNLKK